MHAQDALQGESPRGGTAPKARAKFIHRAIAQDFPNGLTPSQASYALWMGLRVFADYSPYEHRTVTRQVTAISQAKPRLATLETPTGKPITLEAARLRLYTPAPTQDEIQRALAK